MFFDQGLSGLNAAAQSLNIIGKNIANGSTTGYKTASIDFTNVMSNTLNTANSGVSLQTGAGPQSSNIKQLFSQGTITTTNNPLDFAINGNGFFQMKDPATGQLSYTRDGQFQMNSAGGVINSLGQQLMGYGATAGVVSTGAIVPINITASQTMQPQVTSTVLANVDLASKATAITSTFDPTASTTYQYTAPTTVYDQQGSSHTLQLYFAKATTPTSPAANAGLDTWNVYSTSSTPVTSTGFTSLGQISFDASGNLNGTTIAGTYSTTTNSFASVAIDSTGDTATIDLTGSTQQGVTSSTTSMTNNGYASGILNSYTAGADGTITGSYSNGKTQTLGQVALAKFASPNSLAAQGTNSWIQSATSGAPILGVPGAGGLGALQSSALESSNEDQTADMVALLAAQRAYQANAQTIKAEDQIAQTLVNL